MQTYFARHGSDLAIDEETYKQLWKQDLIGIHYPGGNDDHLGSEDSRSLDPDEYGSRAAKGALRALLELSANGGYVCAVYDPFEEIKLGYVEPGQQISFLEGKWRPDVEKDRIAVMKVLKLSRTLTLDRLESTTLLAGRPQQGTFCRWHRIGKRIGNLVEGKENAIGLQDLTPDLQEVMCAEFLRTEAAASEGLPRIESLLLPVGRTLAHIDILGIDATGKKIVVQVTYAEADAAQWKLDALARYKGSDPDALPVLICDVPGPEKRDGLLLYPIRRVFDLFARRSDEGKRWLKAVL